MTMPPPGGWCCKLFSVGQPHHPRCRTVTVRPDPDRLVKVTLPLSHWAQIVSDIEAMCGRSDDIEILSQVTVAEPE
jgi:hypothetical protein